MGIRKLKYCSDKCGRDFQNLPYTEQKKIIKVLV